MMKCWKRCGIRRWHDDGALRAHRAVLFLGAEVRRESRRTAICSERSAAEPYSSIGGMYSYASNLICSVQGLTRRLARDYRLIFSCYHPTRDK